jgi:sarcosine oxidase subunit alpha
LGRRAPVDGVTVDGAPAEDWIAAAVAELEGMENVHLRLRTMVAGVYDHGYVLAYERVSDHAPQDGVPRHRLWRIRTGQVVSAIGAIERPLSFAGNDKPGVMLASAMRDYVTHYGVSPGDRTVVVTNNDDAYRTAIALKQAGLDVPCIVDARPEAAGPLPRGGARDGHPGQDRHRHRGRQGHPRRRRGAALQPGRRGRGDRGGRLRGRRHVRRLVARGAPLVPLRRQADMGRGGRLLPPRSRARRPTRWRGFVVCAGASDGALHASEVMENAARRRVRRWRSSGKPAPALCPQADAADEAPLAPVWIMPQGAGPRNAPRCGSISRTT